MKLRSLSFLSCMGIIASLCINTSSVEGVLASVKTTGMAATGVAYPQDALAGAFNPAGMADVGDRFDIGITWDHTQRHADIEGNLAPIPGINGRRDASQCKNFFTPDFGINKQFCYCGWDFSVGFVAYNRNFNKTSYKHPLPLLGTSKAGLEYIHETFSPTFAVKLWDRHHFGFSVNYMVQRFKVDGIQNFDTEFTTTAPGHVTNRKYAYSQGVGVTLGWRSQLTDWLSIGATYQPQTHMHRFKKYRGFLAQHGKLNIPTKIAGGIAIRFLPCATIAFDVEYIGWNKIKALKNPLILPTPFIPSTLLGNPNAAGFGFRSQTFYRVGIDYDINDCWTVRAGYRYAKSPIRSSQTAVNLLICDTVENFATVGATYIINCNNEVSMFYAHGFSHKISGNSVPIALGGGNVKLRSHTDAVGISWGMMY